MQGTPCIAWIVSFSPRYSASDISACPIDTSLRNGTRSWKNFKVGEAEVVTCIYAKTCLVGCAACLDEGSHCFFGIGGIQVGIGLGVQLHAVGACGCGVFYVFNIGVHEYR